VPVDPDKRKARQRCSGRWRLKPSGSDEAISLGREVGVKPIPPIFDQSPHRFGFHR
jgi:hypothetical protein